MKYLVISNNKIERIRETNMPILEGEMEATEEFEGVEVGMILLDGVWQKTLRKLQNRLSNNASQNSKKQLQTNYY